MGFRLDPRTEQSSRAARRAAHALVNILAIDILGGTRPMTVDIPCNTRQCSHDPCCDWLCRICSSVFACCFAVIACMYAPLFQSRLRMRPWRPGLLLSAFVFHRGGYSVPSCWLFRATLNERAHAAQSSCPLLIARMPARDCGDFVSRTRSQSTRQIF